MIRPKICPFCGSKNIDNINDDELENGTIEFWYCNSCLNQWGIELLVHQILIGKDF